MGILGLPVVWLAPRSWVVGWMRFWAASSTGLVAVICGVRVEIRGREHLPAGPALIAAKHQCMLDTMAPFAIFDDAAYVMKQELMRIPVYGWYYAQVADDRHRPRGECEGAAPNARRHPASHRRRPAGGDLPRRPSHGARRHGRLQAGRRRPLSRPGTALHPDGDELGSPLAGPRLPSPAGRDRLRVPRAHSRWTGSRGVHADPGAAPRNRVDDEACWALNPRPR